MTATLTPDTVQQAPVDAGKPKKAPSAAKLNLSGEPTVQLLPPSVRNRAVARSHIRTAVQFIILGALIAAGLVAVGTVRAGQAQLALGAANNRTTEILAEQAEYTDIVRLNSLVNEAENLQLFATETEIDWAALFRELTKRLPAGGTIDEIAAINFAPWESTAVGGVTVEGAIATVDLSITTKTVQEATKFSRSLSDIDGFGLAVISKTSTGVSGNVTTLVSFALGAEAASGRFLEKDEESEEGAESEEAAETEESTESETPADDATDAATTDGEEG